MFTDSSSFILVALSAFALVIDHAKTFCVKFQIPEENAYRQPHVRLKREFPLKSPFGASKSISFPNGALKGSYASSTADDKIEGAVSMKCVF